MADFSALLFELRLGGSSFSKGRLHLVKGKGLAKLDRFVVSSTWETHFLTLCQKQLPWLCLDHFPLLLDCGGLQEGWRYFKFENMWLKVEGFVENVSLWWGPLSARGHS
ncbi:hypothetical protein I3843_01G131600 [Carya illinoinensis]|uniref:Uncharacterized protein n=1 Tax=Carya illinoinensis TaxID=32201 RepID=A0A922G3I0_CARIL|nr:hypothetical protein I3842_01G138900 [Carya illinoinensis]KAG7995861.1 hypothetical protein I3843_01G131600 [Carya illinoinensis]